MSRLPAWLARRIDRASRRAHLFHRWAHHPLCDDYAGERIALGPGARAPLQLCRGCSLALVGGTAGLASGGMLPLPGRAALAAFALVAVAALAAAVARPRPGAGRRAPKWLTRALPAAAAGAVALLGARLGGAAGWTASIVAAAAPALAAWRYRRRGPDRSPCVRCPEAAGPGPCSGFQPITRREAAFRRLASRWMRRAGLFGAAGGPAQML